MKSMARKPKFSEPTIKKLNCSSCGSIYLLYCTRVKDEAGKRTFKSEFEVVDLTPAAEQAITAKASFKVKKTVSKFIGLGPQDGIILTDLDETE